MFGSGRRRGYDARRSRGHDEFDFIDFLSTYLWPVIIILAEIVLMLVCLLIAIAYVLYADRKIWAAVQMRRGPNVVGPWGLFQSFADMLKFASRSRSSRQAPTRASSCWRRWSPACWRWPPGR